jgi:phenylacetic acid degradation operon negative regulatory protein
MNQSHSATAQTLEILIARLHERGRLRVWSLVITMFGDAIVPRGGRVALSTLQDVLGRLRVEPGALRTAMSRLAADGWVTRERQGRLSFFRLDERGRHAFDLATRRIYAAGPPGWTGRWTVAIAPANPPETAADLPDLGLVRLGGVYLRPEGEGMADASAALEGLLVVHGERADHPDAFRSLWPSSEVAEAYRGFLEAYGPLGNTLSAGGGLSPLDAIAARTLLIHDWRRIVLRDPSIPLALLPDDWPGETARRLMHTIRDRLMPASEAWLGAAALPEPEPR